MFQLRNLQILKMSGISLHDSLPDEMFTSLQSLTELNICFGKLSTLPRRYVYTVY